MRRTTDRMVVGVVVPAAGRGSRLGSPENKIWVEIGGRSVIEWSVAAFQSHPAVDHIVVVGARSELDRLRERISGFDKIVAVVEGGDTRAGSVRRGLAALPESTDVVLVHDAARPCVSASLISKVVDAVATGGAALPGLQVTDTLKRAGESGAILETVSRDGLWAVQTPQGARLTDLAGAYTSLGASAELATDEAAILELAGHPVRIVSGEESNVKITRPGDIERAAAILLNWKSEIEDSRIEAPAVRTGFGYDVHVFAEGRSLWLGGVQIPNSRGLLGHSDADVVLHAVCDGLLGAAGMGDIGVLFPDTDSAHKDRPSIEFVREVRGRLEAAGYEIVNLDVALLAEEPRIGPYRDRMVAAIADGLCIAPTQVNIKATTSEGMGFVGRREGIACWSVATIRTSSTL